MIIYILKRLNMSTIDCDVFPFATKAEALMEMKKQYEAHKATYELDGPVSAVLDAEGYADVNPGLNVDHVEWTISRCEL